MLKEGTFDWAMSLLRKGYKLRLQDDILSFTLMQSELTSKETEGFTLKEYKDYVINTVLSGITSYYGASPMLTWPNRTDWKLVDNKTFKLSDTV